VRDGAGHLAIATGTRYPRYDLVAIPDSIAAQRCEPHTCWAELREYTIDLDPKLVQVYFRDAQPSAQVRQRWQALHADGVPWHERYRKFARIVLDAGAGVPSAGLDLEIVPAPGSALKPGSRARFVLLSKNEPVPGQPVELVSERNPLGIWSRTGADGTVEWPIPFAGEWLVRTIIIEPDGDTDWKSRFATLVFEAR
jgi:hypothetical protein